MQKKCPITDKNIARRYPVHASVFEAALKEGTVIRNRQAGTLRQYVFAPQGQFSRKAQ